MSKTEVKEHTPLPWSMEIEDEPDEHLSIVIPEIGRCLYGWLWAEPKDYDRDLANTKLIVTAVNSHYELLAAAEVALKYLDSEIQPEAEKAVKAQLRTAITEAKGG